LRCTGNAAGKIFRPHKAVRRIDVAENHFRAGVSDGIGRSEKRDRRHDGDALRPKAGSDRRQMQCGRTITAGDDMRDRETLCQCRLERVHGGPLGQPVGSQAGDDRIDVVLLQMLAAVGQKLLLVFCHD
jgi:hypothetical protein